MPTFSYRDLSRERKRTLRILGETQGTPEHWRPKTYGDCLNMPRPCPFVGCKYHLYLDTGSNGSIKTLNGEPEQKPHSCALDVAEEGGKTLEEIGQIMGLTRERVRQIEAQALARIKDSAPDILEEAQACVVEKPEGYTVYAGESVDSTARKVEHTAEYNLIFRPDLVHPQNSDPMPRAVGNAKYGHTGNRRSAPRSVA